MAEVTADLGSPPKAGGRELASETPPAWASADVSRYVTIDDDAIASLHLAIEGIHCPGCIRKIEDGVLSLDGVCDARLNFSTRRLAVRWDPERISPQEILKALEAKGYHAAPFDPATLRNAADAEERALLRALGVAGFATANVMLLSVSVWSGLASDMEQTTRALFHWISALIALPAIVYAGRPFFTSARKALSAGRMNMDVPIALAVILAASLSLYRTIAEQPHVYFDAALMLLFFLLVGRYLDRRLRGHAQSAAQNLLALRSTAATVIETSGELRRVPAEVLRPGMVLQVAAGEAIAADGEVMSGGSSIDTSLVTGESLPSEIGEGDKVFAGTTNLTVPLRVKVSAAQEDTLLAEIVRLMEAAEQRRGRYVRLADRAARFYAPAVHIIAGLTLAGWLLLSTAGWDTALMNAIAVLIITCPCALGLAVPVVQVVASGRLLRRGIIVKAADGLERLAEVDTVVFDKTGTLTCGTPRLLNKSEIAPEDLAFAAGLAAYSRHPLARALAAYGSAGAQFENVQESPGCGLSAEVEGQTVRLGSRAWCGDQDAPADQAAGSELWLSRPGTAPVRFLFRDQLRSDALEVVSALKAKGLRVAVLSGDRTPVVRDTAQALGIEDWKAEQKPDDKIAVLRQLADQGHKVMMVGDGLNDAPALAEAYASLSPASAAEISQTAADFVFQGEGLGSVSEALEISQGARRLVLENFAMAFAYNVFAIPIAVAGLVTPLIAALAMSGSSLIVILNALRLNARRARALDEVRP